MLKRILSIATGVLLGTVLATGTIRLTSEWGWWPYGEVNQSANYLRDVLKLVNENYVEQAEVSMPDLTRSALHGVVAALDPHSDFMEARDYSALQEDMSNQFGGIGVQVEMRDSRVIVIAPIVNTPGERAGILRGDQIVSVNGEALDDASMDDVVGLLRGEPRTPVTIGLHRSATGKDFEVTLLREVIRIESVQDARMIEDGIGYILLTQFSHRTSEEFTQALDRLTAEGMKSLVLDLRNNPGGLLDAAVGVAEPFFNRGELIVYTQGRKPEDREDFLSRRTQAPIVMPIAVLINAGSASAAEIVAGALKDTQRAVIVGERSFGKGSVQSVFRLKNGEGLRLTTARYFTPSGVTIHEKGVEPHVEVVMTPEEDGKVRLQRLRDDITDPVEFRERFGFEPLEDRQLRAAIAVLEGARLLEDRKVAAAR